MSDAPRISVVMAYYDRPKQFAVTLDTYRHWYSYGGIEFEMVVIDDGSPGGTAGIEAVLDAKLPGVARHVEAYDRKPGGIAKNPGPLYNLGVERARGDIIFLTNPENAHIGPVLVVAAEKLQRQQYMVFGCLTLGAVESAKALLYDPERFTDRSQVPHGYYQHSRWNNRLLHFGSAIHREDFIAIGGFASAYDAGDAFEDNDLAEQAVKALDVVVVDSPQVGHQAHPRHTPTAEAYKMNHLAFLSRWGRNPGTFAPGPNGGWVPA